MKPTVKYRLTEPGLSPRRTKLEVPGWAGEPVPRKDGNQEYAFHCVPFSEYAKAGMEVVWPYGDVWVTANRETGNPEFDFRQLGVDPGDGRAWPPLRSFGKLYYTFQVLLDLKVEPGMAVKVETHPRFYADSIEATPIAVPAMIRGWWPMIFFLVFKTPRGVAHLFRHGEPFAMFTIVPEEYDFEVTEMNDYEASERELQSRRIYAARSTITKDSEWTSATNTVFDGTYRRLYGAARGK